MRTELISLVLSLNGSINQRSIVVQTLTISPPLGLGYLLLFPGRPPVRLSAGCLSVCLSVCNSVAILRKITIYNPITFVLSMIMCIQIFVSISLFVLKILRTNWILTEMKGCNSVANLLKKTIYNTNIDLVNDNVLNNLVSISLFVLKVYKKNEFWRKSKALTLLQSCQFTIQCRYCQW